MEQNPKTKYRLVPHPDLEIEKACIQITEEGKFKEVTFELLNFQFLEPDPETGKTDIRYDYQLVYVPPDLEGQQLSEEENATLSSLIGGIIVDIIMRDLTKKEEKGELDGTNVGNIDPSEFTGK